MFNITIKIIILKLIQLVKKCVVDQFVWLTFQYLSVTDQNQPLNDSPDILKRSSEQ